MKSPSSRQVSFVVASMPMPMPVYRDLYSQSFDSVKVMDMHDDDKSNYHAAAEPYLQQLLCHVVPNAAHACTAAREGRIGGGSRNPLVPLHYDLIGVEAWKQDLFGCNGKLQKKTRWKRQDAYNAIRDHQEMHLKLTWKDLPVTTCPSPRELVEFLETSLAYERQLFPTSWQSRRADHESAFWKAVLGTKFCNQGSK